MNQCIATILMVIMQQLIITSSMAGGWFELDHSGESGATPLLDMGALLLDAPAGKRGFIENSNGQLRFSDGRVVRMWGVNLAGASCFPDPARARQMVEHFVRYGFNVVRFHHIDTGFEPNGIFKDAAPGTKELHRKPTGIISDTQLDRLDYFIWLLKSNGIYVDLNLLSGRKFTEADGVRNARELMRDYGQAAKPVSMFDPHLIELQKRFIAELLDHYNPYTNLRYKDDPAVAFLEIANETSLFRYWFSGELDAGVVGRKAALPAFYQLQLDRLWRDWYVTIYPETEVGSVPGRVPWKTRRLHSGQALADTVQFYAEIERKYFAMMRDFIKHDIGSRALISASGHYFSLINLQAQAVADFTSPHYYWDPVRWTAGRWNKHEFAIGGHSVFDVGVDDLRGMTHPVADIAMSHVAGKPLLVTEWNQWYPNPYAYELPLVLAAYGSLHDWDGALVYAYMKERHSEPYRGYVDDFLDIHSNPQALVLNAVASLIFQRGYLNSSREPQELRLDRAETLRNVAGWGSVRKVNPNWHVSDASYLERKIMLSFSQQVGLQSSRGQRSADKIASDTEELVWDSVRRMLVINAPRVRGALGFLAHQSTPDLQQIGLDSDDNGAVMLVSLDGRPLEESTRLLLVCVGETRNSGSQWTSPPFDWGSAPVQMQQIEATLSLPSSSLYKMTRLDPLGYSLADTPPADALTDKVACPERAVWALLEKTLTEPQSAQASHE